jgi:uncharacterized phage protein gp47/JayE
MAAPELTAAGLTIQTYEEALASIATAVRNALGQQVAADSPTSVIGIIDGIVAQLSTEAQEGIQGIYLNTTLDGASGTSLDRLVALGGIYRKAATQSRVTMRFTNSSVSNYNVPAGSLFQIANTSYQFVTPAIFTVPASSYVNVSCLAVATGPVPVNASQSWVWVSSFTGSTSVALSNPSAGVTGTDVETDSALKLRYLQSFGLLGSSTINAIRAAVLSLVDVQECSVFENDTDVPGIVSPAIIPGLPPHSFTAVTKGTALSTDIAQIIFDRKPTGIATYGNTLEIVTDSQGYAHAIYFQTASGTNIYVSAHIYGPASLSALTATIQAALLAYIDGLTIAQPVLYNRIYSIISDTCKAAGTPATDLTVTIGTAPAPVGTSNITIAWDNYAQTQNSYLTIAVN